MKTTLSQKLKERREQRQLPVIEPDMTPEEKNAVRWARLEARTGVVFTDEQKKRHANI